LVVSGDAVDSLLIFSNFDIIAYLMVGLAALTVVDLVFSSGFIYSAKWNTGSVTGVVILAYLGGHLISIPSRALFEGWVVEGCVKSPVLHLVPGLHEKNPRPPPYLCESVIFPIVRSEYFTQASQDVVDRINAKKPSNDADALLHEAFLTARHDPSFYERMETFQRLSLLFRNMALVAFAAAIIAAGKGLLLATLGRRLEDRHLIYYGVPPWMLQWWVQLAAFVVLTIGLLDRYLFYYRLYESEAITAFAYVPPPLF
jgi:hypothetical protein